MNYNLVPLEIIEQHIYLIRNQKVMLDRDLSSDFLRILRFNYPQVKQRLGGTIFKQDVQGHKL
jgi:hypothetical protein